MGIEQDRVITGAGKRDDEVVDRAVAGPERPPPGPGDRPGDVRLRLLDRGDDGEAEGEVGGDRRGQ